jgi:hypothetical protein
VAGEGCAFDERCVPLSEQTLCLDTGGHWDPDTCGHYVCGEPLPILCLVAEPGCDCGSGRSFVEGEGCAVDATCHAPDDEALCEDSGGTWRPESCGHYTCGHPPFCDAIIPGCDCGDGHNFKPGEGCVPDASCTDHDDEHALCEDTGGTWDEATCGHYFCGMERDCAPTLPGCNCGPERNFVEGRGCVLDPVCQDLADERLCHETGGRWDPHTCGHYLCWEESPILCIVPDPGCDCGRDANFVEGRGCVRDEACGRFDDEALCEATGGTWHLESCGHWECGQPPVCTAIIPGCACGERQSFFDGVGCAEDPACH